MDNADTPMPRLALPIGRIRERYAVVVVGSGYGASIAASGLARAGQTVCVLERGRERVPGDFPDTPLRFAADTQVDTPALRTGQATALYDFRVHDDLTVLVASGLGGGSLLNGGVALRPDARIFTQPEWPAALQADIAEGLEEAFVRAEDALGANRIPYEPPKFVALGKSARAMGREVEKVPVTIAFEDGVNGHGFPEKACARCGDCLTGCNHGAKRTLVTNYLADAVTFGAEVFCELLVRRVERAPAGAPGRWRVYFRPLGVGFERFGDGDLFVHADTVVLGAGTLGSTEILQRSRDAGLALSAMLGEGFSSNGDVLAFAYNCDEAVVGIGLGDRDPYDPGNRDLLPGPCITGMIDLRRPDEPLGDEDLVIEESNIPGPSAFPAPEVFAAAAKAVGRDTDGGIWDAVREEARALESLARGPHYGATRNLQTMLIMGHDGADGQLVFEDDRVRMRWPGLGEKPMYARAAQRAEEAARALGGTYIPNPIWSTLQRKPTVATHPLGGCRMADDVTGGVVDHKGRVFDPTRAGAAHDGLYVLDGAIVPRSLGINPLLTIAALAERGVALLARDNGWTIDRASARTLAAEHRAEPATGVEFTERMAGWVSRSDLDGDTPAELRRAAERGRDEDSPCSFTVTIVIDDLARFLSDERFECRVAGRVECPALSSEALVVTGGRFQLAVPDPDLVETRRMRYELSLTDEAGVGYHLSGYKLLHDDAPLDVWADTTTLYTAITRARDETLVARGVLRITVADFIKQLGTMRALHPRSAADNAATVGLFGRHFAGALWNTYGSVAVGPNFFDTKAAARRKRPLRAPVPEVHPFAAHDGTALRLTRFKGGARGPVLLLHGLGVSSAIFSTDLIDTNLVEHLVSKGFDVWLLDYRASSELPAASTRYTADDIARHDHPAAIDLVRELTGAPDVQVVAHCFGGTTFAMSLLGGHARHVRSVVFSQIAAHCDASLGSRIKTGLHLPEFLDAVGFETLTAAAEAHEPWYKRLFDKALTLYPVEMEERCHSATCHRITFLYSLLYEHDKLNAATHEHLHELFGVASITAFQHLGRIVNEGHVVAADGSDDYLPNLARISMPAAFIHGAENACFDPSSTEKTCTALRALHPGVRHRRTLIPDYGHIDCIFGRDAAQDVFPHITAHLEETA